MGTVMFVAIVQGPFIWGQLSGRNFTRDNWPGSSNPGSNYPGVHFSWGQLYGHLVKQIFLMKGEVPL